MTFRPKYITFDCYGTLTYYPMHQAAYDIYEGQLAPQQMRSFLESFNDYRFDEAMGDWKPYLDVLRSSLERACRKHKLAYRDEHARRIHDLVPTWGPHADVPHALTRVGKKIPLVILSNAMNAQIHSNVEKLRAPFHKVYTAEDARAYKPRLAAFEYMLDQLGCAPEDILHVSANPRYDIFSAHELGIVNKVFVNRGHEPSPNAAFSHAEIRDINGLPALVGL
ncbi:MAG TPA: haloacid dehalogenase type II [Ramlibacter sp.]|uniref:haloacid dehalogenase type II n=1 Tax=Ramlibacter sp. TaxID=1917967 RepID=UPI002B7CD523|nr:haloacid dehalogenase type II [Ramlibacter sp.]HVZ44842.1 haloacid dehalogenase type II [Ramlibacter sp.]